jgi:hypothetical protein
LIIGNLNAKIGKHLEGENGIVGRHGIPCNGNDNGEKFVSFCGLNNLAITTAMLPHKAYTCTPGHLLTVNIRTKLITVRYFCHFIDHMAINGNFKQSINR